MVIKSKQLWFLEKLLLGLIKKGIEVLLENFLQKSLLDFKHKVPEQNLFFLLPDLIEKF